MNNIRIISPCSNNCRLDYKHDICIGCGRCSKEITNWIFYSEDERLAIMQDLPNRLRDYQSGKTIK